MWSGSYYRVKPNSRSDTKNLRFFKILLFYSEGFRDFVNTMSDNLGGEDDITSQILVILEQMRSEVLAFKEKGKVEIKSEVKNEVKGIVIKPEQRLSNEERPMRNKRKISDSGVVGSEIQKYLQVKPTTDAILFSNEQDDENGYRMRRKTHKKIDNKTKSYLDYVKQFQYNDEYDDSLNFGAVNQENTQKTVTVELNIEEEQDDDNEDDIEDEDLAYKSESSQSKSRGGRSNNRNGSNQMQENRQNNRGARGDRGAFNRRGRDHKRGSYNNNQRMRNNKREYHNNNR